MSINAGIVLGIGVALVLIILARRWDRRRHEDRLKLIQERIRRRESGAVESDRDAGSQT